MDAHGAVADRVVVDGDLAGDPNRQVKIVTLDFLANGGDGYPFPVPAAGRIDLLGEVAQINAPDPDFSDTNGNGVLDGPAGVDPGLTSFASPGSEQEALSEYLARFHAEISFNQAETPPLGDRRIHDLGIPDKQDTAFEK